MSAQIEAPATEIKRPCRAARSGSAAEDEIVGNGAAAGERAPGIADRLWEIGDIVALVEKAKARLPAKRQPYKKRSA